MAMAFACETELHSSLEGKSVFMKENICTCIQIDIFQRKYYDPIEIYNQDKISIPNNLLYL